MLVIDLIVVAVIVVGAICGWVAGVGRALPVAGFAAGIVLGSRLPLLLGGGLDSDYALVVALPAGLIAGGIGAALAERLAPPVVRLVDRPLLGGFAGAVLVAAAAAVVAWALAPAVSEIRAVRDDVRRSEVLDRFNAVLTPAGPSRQTNAPPPDVGQQPAGSGPKKDAERVPRLLSEPAVKRADPDVVKVMTTRCGDGYQGTGWIAGHGIVVTNAHVVTTAKRVTVMRGGKGASLPATVIWFDGIHDVALLRVPLLRSVPGLPLVDDPQAQTPGFTLGFPSGRKTIRRAQLGETTSTLKLPTLQLTNKAGISLTINGRLVTVIRGLSAPGGSGGPMIDRHGRVLATIFAGITQSDITLAVPNSVVRSAMRRARGPVRVPACGDPPLKPTAGQSMAAQDT